MVDQWFEQAPQPHETPESETQPLETEVNPVAEFKKSQPTIHVGWGSQGQIEGLKFLGICFGIVVLSFGILVAWGSYRDKRVPLPKWEYKIAAPSDKYFDIEMRSFGDDGWELVSARRATNDGTPNYEMIFKRPKQN